MMPDRSAVDEYLLDTNVLREMGKSVPHKNVAAWLRSVDDSQLAISVLTVREIVKGVQKLKKTKPESAATLEVTVRSIFNAFEGRILPIDRRVAEVWGEALAKSEKHVDDTDLAATALVHGLIVVSRNAADFRGRSVKVLDPFKAISPKSTEN